MDSLDKNLGTLNPQVLGSSPRGRTHIDKIQISPDGVQLPPTQGHDRDMGTTQNTAANLAALMMGSRYKQPA